MSRFGSRVEHVNRLMDQEFGDLFDYEPMVEVVNASPEPEKAGVRVGGVVRAILLQPGQEPGSGWSLNAMHERTTSEPCLYFMARGLLTDVRRFDRFTLRTKAHNPDRTGTRTYEVANGPKPVGFGRYEATLTEISVAIRPFVTFADDTIPWEV